jgi:2-succinyl-6-hydroxy-2,4-cyclohexadiene-1-carboxylate synthase
MTPLVFLHGFLGSPDVWDGVVNALQHRGPMERLTLPGHGRRPSREEFEASPFDQPAWLIGYSMGARLALQFMVNHRDRVSGAILIGVNPGLRDEQERRERAAADAALAQQIRTEGLARFVEEWERQPLFASQAELPAVTREHHRQRRLDHTPDGVAWALETFSVGRLPSLWEPLQQNRVPIHVITGARDEKFSRIAEEMVSAIPRCTHTTIAGAGHDVVLERPVALAAEIRAALKEHA